VINTIYSGTIVTFSVILTLTDIGLDRTNIVQTSDAIVIADRSLRVL